MFIVIEGIDGTGKSTLARYLVLALQKQLGPSQVVLTREPTDASPWGKRLRRTETEGRLSREEELRHFHEDRLHHLETLIRPALAEGRVVVCDRYVDSTLAYQAESPQAAAALYARMAPDLLAPDIVLVLDCPVETVLARIAGGREGTTSFEVEETLSRARAIYLSRNDVAHVFLDAEQPPERVLAEALDVLHSRFPTLIRA